MASTSRWKCIQPLGRPVVPGGEGDQRDVVGGGRHRPVAARARRAASRSRSSGASPPYAVIRSPGTSALTRSSTRPDVAQRVADPGDGADRGELLRPLLGQYGHGDRARLHHGEPAGGEPGGGGAAQQDPVAGDDAQVGGQDMGDPVDPVPQLPVASRPRRRRLRKAGRSRAEAVDGAVEQLGPAVQPVGVAQLGQVEDQLAATVRRAADGRGRRCRCGPRVIEAP